MLLKDMIKEFNRPLPFYGVMVTTFLAHRLINKEWDNIPVQVTTGVASGVIARFAYERYKPYHTARYTVKKQKKSRVLPLRRKTLG